MDTLNWLIVSNNQLTSLQDQLPVGGGQLDSLIGYGNRLTSVDGVQGAVHLRLLSLASNRIASVGRLRLPRLKKLNISHNQIAEASIQAEIGHRPISVHRPEKVQ